MTFYFSEYTSEEKEDLLGHNLLDLEKLKSRRLGIEDFSSELLAIFQQENQNFLESWIHNSTQNNIPLPEYVIRKYQETDLVTQKIFNETEDWLESIDQEINNLESEIAELKRQTNKCIPD